jgi:hypothetical protein
MLIPINLQSQKRPGASAATGLAPQKTWIYRVT